MSSDSEIDADGSKMQSEKQALAWGFPKDIAIPERARLKAEAKTKQNKGITNKNSWYSQPLFSFKNDVFKHALTCFSLGVLQGML